MMYKPNDPDFFTNSIKYDWEHSTYVDFSNRKPTEERHKQKVKLAFENEGSTTYRGHFGRLNQALNEGNKQKKFLISDDP